MFQSSFRRDRADTGRSLGPKDSDREILGCCQGFSVPILMSFTSAGPSDLDICFSAKVSSPEWIPPCQDCGKKKHVQPEKFQEFLHFIYHRIYHISTSIRYTWCSGFSVNLKAKTRKRCANVCHYGTCVSPSSTAHVDQGLQCSWVGFLWEVCLPGCKPDRSCARSPSRRHRKKKTVWKQLCQRSAFQLITTSPVAQSVSFDSRPSHCAWSNGESSSMTKRPDR